MGLDPTDPRVIAATRLHDAALVMMGKIDVPATYEESCLYDAARTAVWKAQRFLLAHGFGMATYLLEHGEGRPGEAACVEVAKQPAVVKRERDGTFGPAWLTDADRQRTSELRTLARDLGGEDVTVQWRRGDDGVPVLSISLIIHGQEYGDNMEILRGRRDFEAGMPVMIASVRAMFAGKPSA